MNTNKENTSRNFAAHKAIYNISPFTLLDYPDKTACILWFAGCNMRCLYCYNPDIVLGKGKVSFAEALRFLGTRKGLLDAVVLSGGECSLHKHIEEFIAAVKCMGFLVKVDTNGSKPGLLRHLLQHKLIDYVALDFKAPRYKFSAITKSKLYLHFRESLKVLLGSNIQYEVRSTIHSDLLDQNDFDAMVEVLEEEGYKGNYYLQNFRNDAKPLSPLGISRSSYLEYQNKKADIQVLIRE